MRAIWVVTWAKHTTGLARARANAKSVAASISTAVHDRSSVGQTTHRSRARRMAFDACKQLEKEARMLERILGGSCGFCQSRFGSLTL
jgi:hypothetical protein